MGDEDRQKEGEEFSQRKYMNDSWLWTTVWELFVGVGDRLGGGGQRGKFGTTVTLKQ